MKKSGSHVHPFRPSRSIHSLNRLLQSVCHTWSSGAGPAWEVKTGATEPTAVRKEHHQGIISHKYDVPGPILSTVYVRVCACVLSSHTMTLQGKQYLLFSDEKLRYRKDKALVLGHTASNRQSWDMSHHCVTAESCTLNHPTHCLPRHQTTKN